MRDIDGDLQAPHVVEARRKAFEDFVKEKNRSGYAGTGPMDAALCNYGFSDYFGPVSFERGIHNSCRILCDGGNNTNILLFPSRAAAKGYGDTILPLLKANGYSHSKVSVDQVVLYSSSGNPYTGSLAKRGSYDTKDRFILRIRVRK